MKKVYLINLDDVTSNLACKKRVSDLRIEDNEIEVIYGYSLSKGISPADRLLMVYLKQQGVTKFGVVLKDKNIDDHINQENLKEFKVLVSRFMLDDVTNYFNEELEAKEFLATKQINLSKKKN